MGKPLVPPLGVGYPVAVRLYDGIGTPLVTLPEGPGKPPELPPLGVGYGLAVKLYEGIGTPLVTLPEGSGKPLGL